MAEGMPSAPTVSQTPTIVISGFASISQFASCFNLSARFSFISIGVERDLDHVVGEIRQWEGRKP